MLTEKVLCPAGELYLDYGKGFWEIQRDRFMEIEVWQRDLDRALQVCAAGAVLLELYCWSCIVGGVLLFALVSTLNVFVLTSP